ncbi:MAG: protein kinase [Gemmatimonadota bacterium]|nr:protein kinase [Gemmatimonadota bacterium]
MSDPIARLNAALAGRYEVVREIGEGGMATVYLADDLRHERKVALKVLKPELAAVVGAERFLAEIKTTANLQHPHILPLFDSGEADGFLFYVMPFIEGETLRDRLDRDKQLPVEEAIGIATAVAAALQTAHDAGVVHRDIKPGNILMSRGEPLVSDFGIALAVGAAGGNRLTETGLSVGTPYYMSPEQATGDRSIGPASDVYSLACVLYEMLVGEPPYTGPTPQAVLGKIIMGEPVPPVAVRASIPANMDAAIRKSLEKLPADRFASARDFAAALSNPAFTLGRPGPATPAHPSRRLVAYAGWGVSAILAFLLVARWVGPDAPAPVERFTLASSGIVQNEWLALSPQGDAAVVSRFTAPGRTQLSVQRWSEPSATPLPGTEGAFPSVDSAWDPIFSPDGERIAFFKDWRLQVTGASGGLIQTLDEDAWCCARWASDGFIYYTDRPDGRIARVADVGGQPEPLTEIRDGEAYHAYFHLVRGGRAAVFTVKRDRADSIVAFDIESGRRTALAQGSKSWLTPAGQLVWATRDGQLVAASFDEGRIALARPPRLVVGDVTYGQETNEPYFAMSASGDLLYWRGVDADVSERRELVWVDRAGTMTSVDPEWTAPFQSLALSPDGSRVVVGIGVWDDSGLWDRSLDGSAIRAITSRRGVNYRPAWRPGTSEVSFITNQGENQDLYIVPVDGFEPPRPVIDVPEELDEGVWSPDGRWVVYRSGVLDGERDIHARLVGTDSTIALAADPDADEWGPALSPDGRWLAYTSNVTGERQVWVRPFSGAASGRRQVSVDGGEAPMWAHSGRELFFVSENRLMVATIEAGTTFRTTAIDPLFLLDGIWDARFHQSYAVAPDDDRFLMIRQGVGTSELVLVRNLLRELVDEGS